MFEFGKEMKGLSMKRICLSCALVMAISMSSLAGVDWGGRSKCQILDKTRVPVYRLSGGYVEDADIEGGDDTSMFEVDADWGCAHFRDTLNGDIDLHFRYASVFFVDDTSLDLPEQVSEASFDIAWVNRLQNGWGLIVGLTPGLYSDFETLKGEAFSLPIRVAGVKAFSSHVSGIAGVEYRSDFDRDLFPLIGIAWQPGDAFRLELALPESLICVRPDDIWEIYARFNWNNVTYDLRKRDNDSRETLTIEDYRNTFGASMMTDDGLAVFIELGRSFNRSLVFERRNDSSVELEMDKALFLRVGFAGYF
jgi:hypothetical protein